MLPERSPIAKPRSPRSAPGGPRQVGEHSRVGDGEQHVAAGRAPDTFHDRHRLSPQLRRVEVERGREHNAADRIDQMTGADESRIAASLAHRLALRPFSASAPRPGPAPSAPPRTASRLAIVNRSVSPPGRSLSREHGFPVLDRRPVAPARPPAGLHRMAPPVPVAATMPEGSQSRLDSRNSGGKSQTRSAAPPRTLIRFTARSEAGVVGNPLTIRRIGGRLETPSQVRGCERPHLEFGEPADQHSVFVKIGQFVAGGRQRHTTEPTSRAPGHRPASARNRATGAQAMSAVDRRG